MARAIMGANIAAPGIATDGPYAGQQRPPRCVRR